MLLPFSLLAGSAALDIYANYCVKRSAGFSHWGWGTLSLASIVLAFVILSFAVHYLPLGVAYAVWGSLGMVGTALLDILVFRSPLGKKGWAGIGFIVAGMLLLNAA